MTPPIRLAAGLDVLLRDPSLLRGKRIGLLANAASVTSGFVPAARAMKSAGLDVRILFGPEHGFWGAAQDMEAVDSGGPGRIPVVSLYGATFEDLTPRPEHLDGLDVVVSDLPDVGSRYYTFVWTTVLMMKVCAARGIPVVVLDRPNPLGGERLEGNLPETPLLSFIGLYPVPVRHGMTPGEVATFVNREYALGCDLMVVPMRRGRPFPGRGALGDDPAWVLPSPNMPTRETALVYPGACLVEGTNLSEGRGTTRPFEIVGAPWLDAERMADAANSLAMPGVVFRPHVFRPTFQKQAGLLCGGVEAHVTDAKSFRPFETYLRLIKALRDLEPGSFAWRREIYEYRDDVPAIDLLAGTGRFRELVDSAWPLDDWIATFEGDLAKFAPVRERNLLYPRQTTPPALLVTGAHESGKTTIAVRLIEALSSEGVRVGSLKHTDHEYDTDLAGKDSQRHHGAGAEPALLVAGRRSAAHRKHAGRVPLSEFLPEFLECDVVVVEGFRSEAIPKIEVCRAATGRGPVAAEDPLVVAVVTDRETSHPPHVPRFSFDDFGRLLDLAKRVLGLSS